MSSFTWIDVFITVLLVFEPPDTRSECFRLNIVQTRESTGCCISTNYKDEESLNKSADSLKNCFCKMRYSRNNILYSLLSL